MHGPMNVKPKKFSAFDATRIFITPPLVPTLIQVNTVRTLHPLPPVLRSIVPLSSHLRLGFPGGLLPYRVYVYFLPMRAVYPTHLILLDLITLVMFGEYRSCSFSVNNFLLSPITSSPLSPKYLTQHPTLKRRLSVWETTFQTLTKQRTKFNSVCLNIYIFGQQTGRHKILDRMIAGIAGEKSVCADDYWGRGVKEQELCN